MHSYCNDGTTGNVWWIQQQCLLGRSFCWTCWWFVWAIVVIVNVVTINVKAIAILVVFAAFTFIQYLFFTTKDSNDSSFDYDRNQVGGSVKVQF